jgi:hypothetical protein
LRSRRNLSRLEASRGSRSRDLARAKEKLTGKRNRGRYRWYGREVKTSWQEKPASDLVGMPAGILVRYRDTDMPLIRGNCLNFLRLTPVRAGRANTSLFQDLALGAASLALTRDIWRSRARYAFDDGLRHHYVDCGSSRSRPINNRSPRRRFRSLRPAARCLRAAMSSGTAAASQRQSSPLFQNVPFMRP